jgi:hypothetical protein
MKFPGKGQGQRPIGGEIADECNHEVAHRL